MSPTEPLLPAAEAAIAPVALDLDSSAVAPRQCGRCRLLFEGDPTMQQGAIAEWWLCPPCRDALLPRRRVTSVPASPAEPSSPVSTGDDEPLPVTDLAAFRARSAAKHATDAKPMEQAQIVWEKTLGFSGPVAPDLLTVVLGLSRVAGHESSTMTHALRLGRTTLRENPTDEAVAQAVALLERAIEFLGVKPQDGDVKAAEQDD